MSKRTRSSTISPSKNKRSKTENSQFHIDHFFASSSTTVTRTDHILASESNPPEFIQGSSKQNVNVEVLLNVPEIIDVDSFDLENSNSTKVQDSGPSIKAEFAAASQPVTITNSKASKSTAAICSPLVFAALAVDPIVYDPQSQPSSSVNAPYALLAHAFVALSQTRSRVTIINTLTNLLRTIILNHPSSLLPAVYLLSNSLGPQFIPVELGLGSSIISRSIQQISGLSPAALKRLYNTTGDPGDVAFSAKSNLRTLIPHPPLTVPYVYDSLLRIANCKGQGAAKEKQKIVEKLLLAASGEEVRYLTRTLCQNLRVGAVRTSILTALARAMVLTPPSAVVNQTLDDVAQTLYASADLLLELKQDFPSSSKGKARDIGREIITSLFQQAETLIKQVYVKHPNYDQIIPALLQNGFNSLADRVPLTVGIPVLPMLGSPTRSLDEIYNRLGDLPFTAEFKYDGQRAQIHASQGLSTDRTVKIFSRHLEDMTSKYPDVVALVKSMVDDSADVTSFIMDAEIVAIDPVSGALKTFQELSNRARKDVNLKDIRVSVCVFAFDLMYLNGESLLGITFRERRSFLRTRFSLRKTQESGLLMAHFDFVESCESEDGKSTIEEFMSKAIENRCEGLMIKLLDKAKVEPTAKQSRLKSLPSTYEPDIRSSAWLKLKKDYVDGIGDSLDVIPIGAWNGNGRKAQWWSPVLLALWNPETGRPVAICKCMSGFTDSFYKSMKERYALDSEFCSRKPIWECDFGGFKPEVYFQPHEVWEIRGADITESPVSIAAQGLVSSSRGLSLRFPRFIRVRDDKGIEEASTPSLIADMWRSQQGKGTHGVGNDEGDLIDIDDEDSEHGVSELDESEDDA